MFIEHDIVPKVDKEEKKFEEYLELLLALGGYIAVALFTMFLVCAIRDKFFPEYQEFFSWYVWILVGILGPFVLSLALFLYIIIPCGIYLALEWIVLKGGYKIWRWFN